MQKRRALTRKGIVCKRSVSTLSLAHFNFLPNQTYNIICKNFFAKIPIIGTFIKIPAMARNTSVLLGDHFNDFISAKITSGKYSSASEVIRVALRLLETEEAGIKELNKALSQGERSGTVRNFDSKKHLKELHRKFV